MRFFFFPALLLSLLPLGSAACNAQTAQIDSDQDGLPDSLEQLLLNQFQPHFLISSTDCSTRPAEFTPDSKKPLDISDNGTIYGQAFPSPGHTNTIELHYYDLWRKDCGQAGHPLDAEHVSALVFEDSPGTWKARYWYAAAHEDTLCDASQIARAKALNSEEHGPDVWISAGKHAAFLTKAVCNHGCGADICAPSEPLDSTQLVNLGEISAPLNGAIWISSTQWPLKQKMMRSDFDAALTSRLESLPADDIAWANPGKRPVQAAILGGDAALGGAATGFRATDSALTVADTHTSGAMDAATRKTGNALARSYRGVKKALKAATGPSTSESGSKQSAPPVR